MHFLITGGSGFVGGHLARLLSQKGHAVTALVRKTSNRKELEKIPGIKFAVADLRDGLGLESALEGIDCVQHVAGVTKARTADEYYLGNAEATRLLCQAISKMPKPAKLVYCSSLAAAGPTTCGKPRSEGDLPAPVSTYGKSKLGAELAVRQFADKVPSVIVRPPFVYGPGDSVNLPPLMLMGRLGLYVKSGFGPKVFSFIHVEDLCEALFSAATQGKTLSASDATQGVYFVADPREYSWEDFCQSLNTAMGKGRAKVLPLPEVLGYAVGFTNEIAGRLRNTVPIVSRDKAREMTCEAWTCSPASAAKEISFAPVHDLAGGLKNTVAWYRKEGLL